MASEASRRGRDPSAPPPVEHRLLGLDRRLILPTLGILFVVIFWGGIIPAIDEAIDADEIEPGTVYVVGLAGRVEFAPAAGWITEEVPRPNSPSITIFKQGVTFEITVGAFEGTPRDLLDEITNRYADYDVNGDPRALVISGGVPGLGADISGVDYDAVLFAFVADVDSDSPVDERDIGIQVVAEGPPDVTSDLTDEVAHMIASIRIVDSGGDGEGAE